MRWAAVLCAGVATLTAGGSGEAAPAPAAPAGPPSAVTVTVSAAACHAVPARVPNGAVRFTIRNRSAVSQRLAIGSRRSVPVPPGAQAALAVTLDDPAVHTYSCIPSRGAPRRGSLRVARNVVVESDLDASAAMAILYLLSRVDVEVAAIVVDGSGEARCPAGATNALVLAALAGKPKLPVGCGRPYPLQGRHAFPAAWRDYTDGFFGVPRPAAPARPAAGTGEQVYRDAIRSAPGRVDVVTDGPPTELAAFLLAEPALHGRIRSVTMMGGAVRVPGNVAEPGIGSPHAEWNFYVDPHAANVVLRSGLAVTLVPLDATNDVPLNAAVAARLGRSPAATFVRRLIESLAPSGDAAGAARFFFWDPLTAAVLVEPAVGRYAELRLAVVEREGADSGRVIEAADGARVRVATSADRARFESSFASTLR